MFRAGTGGWVARVGAREGDDAMTEPNGGGGDGGSPPTSVLNEENELLGFTEVLSFTADPAQVEPFQPTTLSWSVQLPTHLTVPVEIGIVGQMSYQTSGTATVKPFSTTVYELIAKTAITSRALAPTVTVTVDQSGCVSGNNIPGPALTGNFRNQLAQMFQGGSNYRLGDAGYTVSINEAESTIDINVPLVIEVPDWFDGNMTMSASIYIAQQGVPPQASALVQARNVTADVSWSWYSDLLSVGNTASMGDGMTQLAQVFLSEIVAQQVVVPLQSYVNQQIQASIEAAQLDHHGETFVLTSFGWDTNENLSWTLCPLSEPGPVLPPGQIIRETGEATGNA